MSRPDSNAVIRAYLVAASTETNPLIALIVDRVFCPRLPKGTTLPAVSFFTRGGKNTPYVPDIANPSVQFDCWGPDPITARNVYRKLYDALQGIQNVTVVVGGDTYSICSAEEEVEGQDLVDEAIPNYFRTLTFFKFMIK